MLIPPQAALALATALAGTPTVPLEPGMRETFAIQPGEGRRHHFVLDAGQFLQATVHQRGVDVVLRLLAPDGSVIQDAVDASEGTTGREGASILARESGTYAIEVWLPRLGPDGAYEIDSEVPRVPSARDRVRLEAERLTAEGARVLPPRWSYQHRPWPTAERLEQARPVFEAASSAWASLGEPCGQAEAEMSRAWSSHYAVGQCESSLDHYLRALELWQTCGDDQKFGETVLLAGRLFVQYARLAEAAETYEFGLALSSDLDPILRAQFMVQLANAYGLLGDTERAIRHGESILPYMRERDFVQGQAVTLTHLANAHYRRGDLEKASEHAVEALPLRRLVGNEQGLAETLVSLGDIYAALGEPDIALGYLEEAIERWGRFHGGWEADARSRTAAILVDAGRPAEALPHLERAIALGDWDGGARFEVRARLQLVRLSMATGDWIRARENVAAALRLGGHSGDRFGLAEAQELSGRLHLQAGDHAAAGTALVASLALRRSIGDRVGEATVLRFQAQLARASGDLDGARGLLQDARAIVEAQRGLLATPQLRASWASTVRAIDEERVDVLMALHRLRPDEGFARAGVRGQRVRIRPLAARPAGRADRGPGRRDLGSRLPRAVRSRAPHDRARPTGPRRGGRRAAAAARDAIAQEVRDLSTEHVRALAALRAGDARSAAWALPVPLRLGQVQSEVLEADTTLLEFSLGEERGHAFVVGRDRLDAYELPGARARRGRGGGGAARARGPSLRGSGRPLGRGPALPGGAGAAGGPVPPARHAPGGGGGRRAAPRAVRRAARRFRRASRRALRDRERSLGIGGGGAAPPGGGTRARAARRSRSSPTRSTTSWTSEWAERPERGSRTPGSRGPPAISGSWTAACRGCRSRGARRSRSRRWHRPRSTAPWTSVRTCDAALSPDLASYRYVHFAAHGLLNDARPDLSGLVLSLVDREGTARPGLLTAPDVVEPPAGCGPGGALQLPLGGGARGARARVSWGSRARSCHAGAPRVVASLWPVDDMASAELMTAMYRGMLGPSKLSPAAALRRAQRAMLAPPQVEGVRTTGRASSSRASGDDRRTGHDIAMLIPPQAALALATALAATPHVPIPTQGGRETFALGHMQWRRHEIALEAGQFLRATVHQRGVDVKLRLVAPDGRVLHADVDVSEGTTAKEPASILATVAGTYGIEVWTPHDVKEVGRYELETDAPRLPDERDRRWLEAEDLMVAGGSVLGGRSASYRRNGPTRREVWDAVAFYALAAPLWSGLGDGCWEAEARTCLGINLYWADAGEPAFDNLARALDLWQACPGCRLQVHRDRAVQRAMVRRAVAPAGRRGDLRPRLAPHRRQDPSPAVPRPALARVRPARRHRAGPAPWGRGAADPAGGRVDTGDLRRADPPRERALPAGRVAEGEHARARGAAVAARVRTRGGPGGDAGVLGDIYDALGEPEIALTYLDEATRSTHEEGRVDSLRARSRLAAILARTGHPARARAELERAINLASMASLESPEIRARLQLASLSIDLDDWREARSNVDAVLAATERSGDRYLAAQGLELSGRIHLHGGDHAAARAALVESLALRRAIGDREGEATALHQRARVEIASGDLESGRDLLVEARAIVARQRGLLATPQLRATWAGNVRGIDEAYVGVLMDLHRRRPDAGFDARAFEASESASARSLLEALSEPGASVGDPASAPGTHERSVRERLTSALDRQMRARNAREAPAALERLEQEVLDLSTEHDARRPRSERATRATARCGRPSPCASRMCKSGSSTRTRRSSSSRWERSAVRVAGRPRPPVRVRPARPGAHRVGGRRGAYRAGPGACSRWARSCDGRPCVIWLRWCCRRTARSCAGRASWWSRMAPSTTSPSPRCRTRAASRSSRGSRSRACRRRPWPRRCGGCRRSARRRRVRSRWSRTPCTTSATRGSRGTTPCASSTRRSRRRRAASASRTASCRGCRSRAGRPSRSQRWHLRTSTAALDFSANLDTALSPDLASYRYVHFAAHGLLNDARPELSGLVLSLVDRDGRTRPGLLTAPDVSSLRLNADLVVLSSCRSAAGREVRGEGLVGLTRAFMSAGAPRVVASLWPVDDMASAELMTAHVPGDARALEALAGGRPAGARRKRCSATASGRHPYYWAGFQLQGEWR